MIPALTFIIAAYVITRMLELYSNEKQRGEASRDWLQVCAGITIVIAIGACIAVQSAASDVAGATAGYTVPSP